jgi:hypothetical protein
MFDVTQMVSELAGVCTPVYTECRIPTGVHRKGSSMFSWLTRMLPWMVGVGALGAGALASAEDPRTYAFGPGEQTTYKVHYLGITAGSAQVTVGAEMSQQGQMVWPIVTLAKTDSIAAVYPVKDKFVTYWDFTQQRTVGNDLFADENRNRRRQRITMDHATKRAKVVRQKEGSPESVGEHDIEPNALDVAAAMFALRTKTIKVGETYRFPVFTGDRMFTLEGVCEARQPLKTALGVQDVFKLRIRAEFGGKLEQKRDMNLYVTTDAKHLPVRVDADLALGSISAEITDYKPGREIVLRATEDTSAQATSAP